MLEHLEIRNFALIDNLSIDFSEGFNVITGETGSGKSIILGALGLLMGEKADSSAIRNGCDEIVVNAVISIENENEIHSWLQEHEIYPEDGQLIIKRTVKANGKSVIRVQNQLVTRSDLTILADSIIDMHGQSDHQSLLSSDNQRKVLDSYSHNNDIIKICESRYRRISELEKKEEQILKAIEEGTKQRDYLKFALDEIESAKLKAGEDQELKDQLDLLKSFETVYENVSQAVSKLKDTRVSFYDAQTNVSKAAKCDSNLTDYVTRLESSRIETEDICETLMSYISNVDYSEDKINSINDRLALIQKLKRKYGPTIEEIIAFANEARQKLDVTENSQIHLDKCREEINLAKAEYLKTAFEISNKRKESAKILEKRIEDTLKTLGMPNVRFEIQVVSDETKPMLKGIDSVNFMICPNPGEELKQMKEIASGGELSRVMLALKTVLAKADSIETQVFDEVDAGIGGSVALSLANCISDLAKEKQVVVITHLATVASRAKCHFVVSKTVENERTFTRLKTVEGEQRVHEIARMLSGDESSITLEHARKMLES